MAQRHHRAAWRRHQHAFADRARVVAQVARVADDDAVPLPSLDRRGHHLATQRRRDHVLHVADRQSVAGDGVAIGRDFEVPAAFQPFREGARGARHSADHLLHPRRHGRELPEVGAVHLHSDGRAYSGGQHVDAGADRLSPGIADARQAQCLVHLRPQRLQRHAGPPLARWPQVDERLEHLGRCRVGGGRGPAGLAEYGRDLGERPDDPVLRLQQLGRLGDRQPRRGDRHEQQRALVQLGHELAAQLARRPHGRREPNRCQQHQQQRRPQHAADQRPIEPDQGAIDGVAPFGDDLSPDECHHQHRHQRDRQQRAGRHSEGLGVGQRLEHPALLSFEREHRQERHDDNQQAEEQ